MVRVEWTPHVLSYDLRTNWHLYSDPRVPLEERMATHEGALRCVKATSKLNRPLKTEVFPPTKVAAVPEDASLSGRVYFSLKHVIATISQLII